MGFVRDTNFRRFQFFIELRDGIVVRELPIDGVSGSGGPTGFRLELPAGEWILLDYWDGGDAKSLRTALQSR